MNRHGKSERPWIVLLAAFILAPAGALHAQISTPAYGMKQEHVWIPMKDGIRLSANLLVPTDARPGEKFPAIFHYDPYRNNDNSDTVEECDLAGYFVARGYVSACVEIRGTGASEGRTPPREYSEQELSDGEAVIDWLARQPWSNGAVAMFGLSWSGFNDLQLAMRGPPALKLVISGDSTEELYSEDVHYYYGILNPEDWMFAMDTQDFVSRAPDFPIDEKTLSDRFDSPPWSLLYLHHQREDAFWHEPEKSLDAIRIPTFVIGGFVDGYRDTIPRLLAKLKSPVRAVVGPWEHAWPNKASVGPAIEWRDLALRWLDQFLKGRDNGVTSDPKLTVYMRHWFPPDPRLTEIPGEWRSERGWPPEGLRTQTLCLDAEHSLGLECATPAAVHSLKYVPSIGVDVGPEAFDLQPDQRSVDAFSLVYDSAPLDHPRAILGFPVAQLRASATARLANWFVRLSDVAPDGQVTLITQGALNGAQRESSTDPRDLEPNKIYSLRVSLRFTSWVFPQGHRMRLSISNAQFPMFWPTPYPMTTSLYLGGEESSRLLLPIVPLASPLPPPRFPSLTQSERSSASQTPSSSLPPWTLHRSAYGKPTVVDFVIGKSKEGWSEEVWPWGSYAVRGLRTYQVQDDHPEAASYSGHYDFRVRLAKRELLWHSEWNLRSDTTDFHYLFKRELWQDGKLVRQREWADSIPRDHQ